MNLDLRPYAERLAKAMPERFESDDKVWLNDRQRPDHWIGPVADMGSDWWAFFGPLLDEFRCDRRRLMTWMANTPSGSWLEATAEAVCQAAEAKAKESKK